MAGKFRHRDMIAKCRELIPPLSGALHKGQAGRIAILGGSKDYTGAPFFSGMSTLRAGSDLAHIICDPQAGQAIKTYAPDLIVHPNITDDSTEASLSALFESLFARLHVLVIGPGLGRSEVMELAARTAIDIAKKKNLLLVIDADGLWVVGKDLSLVRGYKSVVLTPNWVEFQRLCDSAGLSKEADEQEDLIIGLGNALQGPTILQKGAVDRISNGRNVLLSNDTKGSFRRCGGQGDILSGLVGTFLAWGVSWEDSRSRSRDIPLPILAAYAASTVTRNASRLTFEARRRAMQTSDMLDFVGPSFEQIFESNSHSV